MSKVDDVFDFADELIDEWGHYVTFVRKENSVYDPETGSTTETETRQQVKVVISKLNIREYEGLYQANDVKIILDPVQVNYIYITEQDYFLVPRECARRNDESHRTRHLPRRQSCCLRHHREAAVMARAEFNSRPHSLGRQHQKRAEPRNRSRNCQRSAIPRPLVQRRICQKLGSRLGETTIGADQRTQAFFRASPWSKQQANPAAVTAMPWSVQCSSSCGGRKK